MRSKLIISVAVSFFAGITFCDQDGFLCNGVTAHRGNSAEFPENTMPAFKSALDLGVDWIELDIYKTGDGKIAVIHDIDTKRVGNGNFLIFETPFNDLKNVDVAQDFRTRKKLTVEECPPAHMPLLSDVIQLVIKQSRTRVSIQPKNNCVKDAVLIIKELKAEKWVGFNDGSLPKMKEVKQLDKSIPVFWDRPPNTDIDDDIRIAKECGFESIVMNQAGVTQEKIDKIHKAQLKAGVWTVNDPSTLKRFLDMGIDRIYTDDPRTLLELKKAKKN